MTSRRRNDAGRLIPGPIAEFVRAKTGMPIVLVGADDTLGGTPGSHVTQTELVHPSARAHAA